MRLSPTNDGAIILRMGKTARASEPMIHSAYYESIGIPILGRIETPGVVEGGDMVWLDGRTLLIGRGYRTNETGIDQVRSLLAPKGIEVMETPLPHGPGPDACLHLMSLLSVLDTETVLVDLAWLSVSTVELLDRHGYERIEIVASERDTLACNVLALGDRRLLALEENRPHQRPPAGAWVRCVDFSRIGNCPQRERWPDLPDAADPEGVGRGKTLSGRPTTMSA